MRFVDEATITVRSGNGGHGCVSFRREKYVPKGGPDGGDGGRGGDVIFRAEPRLLTLYDFRLKRRYQAQNGQGGQGKQKFGRAGENLVINVPVGTLIYELEQDEAEVAAEAEAQSESGGRMVAGGGAMVWELPDEDESQDVAEDGSETGEGEDEAEDPRLIPGRNETLLADLAEPGQEVVVAKGGRGGKGNTHFKSATMRTPRFAQPGEEGGELRIRLVLKILADCGLIGLPNAGKSTLISALSAARPKIAPYPFTTLTPNLGVMEREPDQRLIVADIPGLIQGAHQGLGLGTRFLKHVERTRFLVHLLSLEEVDPDWEAAGTDPFAGFDLVNEELASFDARLTDKPQLLVLNKIDLWEREALEPLVRLAEARGLPMHFVSALKGWGLDRLAAAMWSELDRRA